MERKWTEKQYHVQDNAAVEHQDVKNYCNTSQFPELSFCGPHSKPHGANVLSKHYNLRFYPKLGMGKCAIFCMPCACVSCTSMIDKPWISGILPDEKQRYKPVTKFNYWPVLWSFNNFNIIQFSHKSTPSDAFDEMHQVVLDLISDNTASLFESVKYVDINTTDTTTNGFYVIVFKSEAYTLQDNTTIDGEIIAAG